MFLQNYKTKWKTKNYRAVIIQTTAFFTLAVHRQNEHLLIPSQ